MSVDSRLEEGTPALPPGTRFGELEILGTLGVGGFGIVYLARDHSLEREIAIKEYMPSQFALRDGQSHVSVRSVSMKETFELGRRSFVNEAKLLARFDHPSLLKVYRFWEANGTAYMAMPRLVGHNLREARKARSTPPPEGWVRRIFDAVLSGLDTLHSQQVWHRDVAPDNIFLPADGSAPILLDFGAARQAIGDRTQVFTAILKPSFAPIEQYAEATTLKQGPWTDFYALAAAMHELLTGRPPPPATARAMGDEMAPLAVPGYSATFLAALEWALRVAPHQRPPTVAAWREVLEGRAPVPEPLPMPSRSGAAQPPPTPSAPPIAAPAGALDLEFADTVQGTPSQLEDDAATVVVPKSAAKPPKPTPPPPPPPAPPAVRPPPPATPAVAQEKTRWPLFAAAGGAVVVLLGVFITQLGGKSQSPQMQVREPAASEASLPVPAPASVVAPAPMQPTPAASVAGTVPLVPAPATAPASTPAIAKPSPNAGAASGPARPASAAARRDAASKPVVTEKPGESRPVPRSPVSAAPEQAAPSTTAAASKAAPAPAAAPSAPAPSAEPKTAGEACGGRVLFARAWCIDRQCEKPIYQNDAECVKLREIRNSRNGNP